MKALTREKSDHTFEAFIERVYLPVYEQKWKDSTNDSERTGSHSIWPRNFVIRQCERSLVSKLQRLLDATAQACARSKVDHLRFRLRSIFGLAVSEE